MEVSTKQAGAKRFDDPGITAALVGDADVDGPVGALEVVKCGKLEPKVASMFVGSLCSRGYRRFLSLRRLALSKNVARGAVSDKSSTPTNATPGLPAAINHAYQYYTYYTFSEGRPLVHAARNRECRSPNDTNSLATLGGRNVEPFQKHKTNAL